MEKRQSKVSVGTMPFDIEQIRLGSGEQLGKEGECLVTLSLHCASPWHTHRCSNLWFHTWEESHRALYLTSVSFLNLPEIWLWTGITFQTVSSQLEIYLLPTMVSAGVLWWKTDLPWGQSARAPMGRSMSKLRSDAIRSQGDAFSTQNSLKEVEWGHGASLQVIRYLGLWISSMKSS